MKKKKKAVIVIVSAVIALVAVVAAYVIIPDRVKDISGIDEEKQTIYLGETLEPEYKVKPEKFENKKNEIVFEMSDPEVAEVDSNGSIIAHKIGETILTLSVMNFEKEVTIKVIPTVTAITNIDNAIELIEGETKIINPKIVPAEKRFADKKANCKIIDEKIAILTDNKIKAICPGTTELIIEAGGIEKTVKVIVNEYIPPEPEPQPSNNYYNQGNNYVKDKSQIKKNVQETEGKGSFDLSE